MTTNTITNTHRFSYRFGQGKSPVAQGECGAADRPKSPVAQGEGGAANRPKSPSLRGATATKQSRGFGVARLVGITGLLRFARNDTGIAPKSPVAQGEGAATLTADMAYTEDTADKADKADKVDTAYKADTMDTADRRHTAMTTNLGQFINRFTQCEGLPLHMRIANMIYIIGAAAGALIAVSRALIGASPYLIGIGGLTSVALIGFLYLCNHYTKLYNTITCFTTIVVCDILFPMTFFVHGGFDSSVGACFVLCSALIFTLFKGARLAIMIVAHVAVVFGLYALGAFHPAVASLIGEDGAALSQILSMVFIGICMGCIVKFVIDTYERERAREEELEHKALAASKAKGDFLANMSHEMRTPMNAIIGMTQVGSRSFESRKKQQALDKIDAASKHLLGVINNILDMSKIEAGKFELSPVPFDFRRMMQMVTDVVAHKIEQGGLTLEVDIAEDLPLAMTGDDQRLAQVITNLLGNAVKFTPEGGVIGVKASVLSSSEAGTEVEIRVSDTGIGISEEQQARLFSAFEQADNSTSRTYGGTGLGLAISKSIVELMGGSIRIESELGSGSTFIFTVILEECAEGLFDTDEGSDLQSASDASSAINYFGAHHILIAEDIDINREIITALLEPTGIEITFAEDGEKALNLVTENPGRYGLIFMDVQMPKMDGFEATRRIRNLPEDWVKDLPIIAMTASVFKEDIRKCLEAGMDGHVSKPINLDNVLRCLRTNLKKAA